MPKTFFAFRSHRPSITVAIEFHAHSAHYDLGLVFKFSPSSPSFLIGCNFTMCRWEHIVKRGETCFQLGERSAWCLVDVKYMLPNVKNKVYPCNSEYVCLNYLNLQAFILCVHIIHTVNLWNLEVFLSLRGSEKFIDWWAQSANKQADFEDTTNTHIHPLLSQSLAVIQ